MTSSVDALAGRRLIFTVTPGRSGTDYLSRALGLFRDVHAEHEPKPTFSSVFRTVVASPRVAREFWLDHKLPRIARSSRPIYAETSHLVCKGFLEPALELGLRPDLIHLVRDPRAVATSLWRLSNIPGRTLKGVKYYLSPTDVGLSVRLDPADVARLDDYQLCYWYCLEIEARARAWAERAAGLGLRLVRAELEQLLRPEGLLDLGRALELGPLSAVGKVRLRGLGDRRVNERPEKKRPMTLAPERLEELEAEVLALAGVERPQASGAAGG